MDLYAFVYLGDDFSNAKEFSSGSCKIVLDFTE